MIRALLLSALLILPAPVEAARLLVVGNPTSTGNDAGAYRITAGVLEELGVAFDYIPYGAARTNDCRTGVRVHGARQGAGASPLTTTYAGIIHLNYRKDSNSSTSGYFPDSLTLCAGSTNCSNWPSVPQVFAGVHGVPGATWTDGATCSTGVRTNNAVNSGADVWYAQALSGNPEVWRSNSVVRIGVDLSAPPPGIFRPIVSQYTAASTHARVLPTSSACTDCDSTRRVAPSFSYPDSVVMWARYRDPASAPLIFVDYAAISQLSDPALIAMAVAMVDSFNGGTVITKKKKIAFAVDGMFRTGRYSVSDAADDTLRTGIFCASDSCDTTNIAATMDSINALNVPVTFAVAADSVNFESMQYHKRLIERVSKYRVAISNASGLTASEALGSSGAASTTTLRDLFGHTRARQLFRVNASTTAPYDCAASSGEDLSGRDTSLYCMLQWADKHLQAAFPGKVSRVLMPAMLDFTPSSITRADQTTLDSLLWMFNMMNFNGAVVSVMSRQNTIGRSTLPRGPLGLYHDRIDLPVRHPGNESGARVLGRFRLLPTRGADNMTPLVQWIGSAGHIVYQEEAVGYWGRNWYTLHDNFNPNGHNFDGRTVVVKMPATTLGGSGQGTYNPMHAYRNFKYHANRFSAINKLAGRSVAEIVTLDELVDAP